MVKCAAIRRSRLSYTVKMPGIMNALHLCSVTMLLRLLLLLPLSLPVSYNGVRRYAERNIAVGISLKGAGVKW